MTIDYTLLEIEGTDLQLKVDIVKDPEVSVTTDSYRLFFDRPGYDLPKKDIHYNSGKYRICNDCRNDDFIYELVENEFTFIKKPNPNIIVYHVDTNGKKQKLFKICGATLKCDQSHIYKDYIYRQGDELEFICSNMIFYNDEYNEEDEIDMKTIKDYLEETPNVISEPINETENVVPETQFDETDVTAEPVNETENVVPETQTTKTDDVDMMLL